MKVSCQVTGIRKDPWANANRIQAEVVAESDNRILRMEGKEIIKPYPTILPRL
jgi:hypothetical protein